jgi:hypothetical protein
VSSARRAISILMTCILATAASVALAEPAKAEINNAPGYVHLRNVESGTCIDAVFAGPGSRIVMWRCLNTEFEEWQLVRTPIPGNRFHHCGCTTVTMFINHAMSMCMAVENDGSASGTAVVQQNCDPADEKQWWHYRFETTGGKTIRSFISNKVLDVDLGRSDNGVPLQIWTSHSRFNQKWTEI